MRRIMPKQHIEILGAVKIFDGLFLGDEWSAKAKNNIKIYDVIKKLGWTLIKKEEPDKNMRRGVWGDFEFIMANKINRVINCAGKSLHNNWESVGIRYLSFPWSESDTQVIFDVQDNVINTVFKFIEEGVGKGEGVLIHSVRGQNRSCCIVTAYLMKKFKWTLYKTLEFLHSRRPDLEMRSSFFNQLINLETRIAKIDTNPRSFNWDYNEVDISAIEADELLLRNTYLNSKPKGFAEFRDTATARPKSKITWSDIRTNDKSRLITTIIPPYDKIPFNSRKRSKSANPSKPIIKAHHEFKFQTKATKDKNTGLHPRSSSVQLESMDKIENPMPKTEAFQQPVNYETQAREKFFRKNEKQNTFEPVTENELREKSDTSARMKKPLNFVLKNNSKPGYQKISGILQNEIRRETSENPKISTNGSLFTPNNFQKHRNLVLKTSNGTNLPSNEKAGLNKYYSMKEFDDNKLQNDFNKKGVDSNELNAKDSLSLIANKQLSVVLGAAKPGFEKPNYFEDNTSFNLEGESLKLIENDIKSEQKSRPTKQPYLDNSQKNKEFKVPKKELLSASSLKVLDTGNSKATLITLKSKQTRNTNNEGRGAESKFIELHRDNIYSTAGYDINKRVKKKNMKIHYKIPNDSLYKQTTQQIYSAPIKQYNNFFGGGGDLTVPQGADMKARKFSLD